MSQNVNHAILMLLVVTPFVIAALARDLKARKLPNALCVTIALLSVGLHTIFEGMNGLLVSVLGLVVGFGVLLPFYICRMIGAGDVKFQAAMGAFLAWPLILPGTLVGVIIGGAGSLVTLLRQKREVRDQRAGLVFAKLASPKLWASDFASYDSLSSGTRTVPYSIYLGLGAVGTALYHIFTF